MPAWSDQFAVWLLIEQLEGLQGDAVEIADASLALIGQAADRARRTARELDALHLFRLIWQYPAVRRQPWVPGIRPYLAWRLYGELPRIVASILAGDLLDDAGMAIGWGRDDRGLWFPDRALVAVVDDLDLVRTGRFRDDHPIPAREVDRPWIASILRDAAGGALVPCWLHQPGLWCCAPGWTIPLSGSPSPIVGELLDAYRRRPGSSMAIPVTAGYAWIAGLSRTPLPELAAVMLHPIPGIVAFHAPAARSSWELTVAAGQRVPDDFRWQLLLHATRSLPLAQALRDFLLELLARFLSSGVYLLPAGDGAVWTRAVCNDSAPRMPRITLLFGDAEGWIDATIIPVLLTQVGLVSEAFDPRPVDQRWRCPTWSDLTASWGLGPVLLEAWPERQAATESEPSLAGTWLRLPDQLTTLIRQASAAAHNAVGESEFHEEAP